MKGDPQEAKQGKVTPLVFIGQRELPAQRDDHAQNDDSHCKAQPDDRDGRDIRKRHLCGDK